MHLDPCCRFKAVGQNGFQRAAGAAGKMQPGRDQLEFKVAVGVDFPIDGAHQAVIGPAAGDGENAFHRGSPSINTLLGRLIVRLCRSSVTDRSMRGAF